VMTLTEKKESQSDKKEDPCRELLTRYTDCVSSHTKGLSEGDDCGAEATAYKECRRKDKEQKLKNTSK